MALRPSPGIQNDWQHSIIRADPCITHSCRTSSPSKAMQNADGSSRVRVWSSSVLLRIKLCGPYQQRRPRNKHLLAELNSTDKQLHGAWRKGMTGIFLRNFLPTHLFSLGHVSVSAACGEKQNWLVHYRSLKEVSFFLFLQSPWSQDCWKASQQQIVLFIHLENNQSLFFMSAAPPRCFWKWMV